MNGIQDNGKQYTDDKCEEILELIPTLGSGVMQDGIIGYAGETIPEGYDEIDEENITDLNGKTIDSSLIYDEKLGRNISGGEKYLEDEQIIGEWIDGKPIYRKVWIGTTASNSNNMNYFTIQDVDMPINYYGTIAYDENTSYPINGYNGQETQQRAYTFYSRVNNSIRGNVGNNLYNKKIMIVFEYTKTTD